MKVSIWIMYLGIYLTFIMTSVGMKNGTVTTGGIPYTWYDPILFGVIFGFPALLGYMAGKEDNK